MYLIAGLGNPDKKYSLTRHNIGFDAIDFIADKYFAKIKKTKHKSVYGECEIAGEKVILAKPQTYMNNSGESIKSFASFYKIPTSNIIIIHDDVNISLGRIRIRPSGSDGGHNGIKSIIYHLCDDNFTRVKIGVGKPENSEFELADYVLSKFSNEEINALMPILKATPDIVHSIIADGSQNAMNKYNGMIF